MFAAQFLPQRASMISQHALKPPTESAFPAH
jgi:hypothetical protein